MGYETKVILKAIIKIMQNSKDLQEAIEAVKDIANAEDVVSDNEDMTDYQLRTIFKLIAAITVRANDINEIRETLKELINA